MNAFEIPETDELPATTPGPWHTAYASGILGLIVSEDGENIAVSYKQENAALIAAAPELLDALTEYLRVFDDGNVSDAKMKCWLDEEWIPIARAAIAKAEGAK